MLCLYRDRSSGIKPRIDLFRYAKIQSLPAQAHIQPKRVLSGSRHYGGSHHVVSGHDHGRQRSK
jgi:hypothetical protein